MLRSSWLRGGSLVAFAILAASPPQTLRDAASSSSILIGAAVRPSLLSEASYSATLSREFNMVEAEDAMKWWIVRASADGFDFQKGDDIVHYAQAHGMKVRGHCLVWDHNNPKWLTEGHFSAEQMAKLLEEHISAEMKHYSGQVFAWDVVNEALDENGNVKDSPWYNQPGIGFSGKGTAYVEQSFRWARKADGKALLFYNDTGGEGLNRKSDAIYAMLQGFKQRGVPVDGVGLQMHISRLDYDTDAIAKNIARLTKLGLQVHITELDVSLPVDSQGEVSKEDLEQQAEIYRRVVRACVTNPGCTAIQTWGFTDKYSWIGSHSHGTRGAALPFDSSYQPKPAYQAVLRGLASRPAATH